MEKYRTYLNIDKTDIPEFHGLETEVRTSVLRLIDRPLNVSTFGITFPNPKYYISRPKSLIFVLEYVVSGKGTVICNGKKFTVKANDVYLLQPGDDCEYYADKNDPFHKYWINFSSSLFPEIIKKYNLNTRTVFEDVDIRSEFEQIFALDSDPCLNDSIYTKVSTILFQIIMKLAERYPDEGVASPLAQRIRYELASTIKLPFNLDDICNRLYLSKSQLIREFKKYYHTTPYQFLLNMRMEVAKTLLKNTTKTVREISQTLCFSSEYNFSNYFKKRMGVSPRQYRKEGGELI